MTKRLACTAEPFGYGPSSSLAQIVSRMRTLGGAVEASYVGSGHTLDFAHAIGAYGGRVRASALDAEALREVDAALIVTDFAAAEAARQARVPFAIYDPLAWYWRAIPEVCRSADLYLCQDFFGVRGKLADAGIDNAVVVPPLTPEIETPASRNGILISLGGLGNPHFTAARCVDYARAVLSALRRATAGESGPVTSLTSKQIAESLPGLDVATLPPDEVHRRIASARVCFLTPGLGQLYEASALSARAVWLPPANDSQGRQLRELVARDMAPGAIDWHQVLDVPRVDYYAPQDQVMRTLSGHMETLLEDERAQARLAAVVRARMRAVTDAQTNPLDQLVIEHGRSGAPVAAKILDAWLGSLGEARTITARTVCAASPGRPRRIPLTVPRENRADASVVSAMRALHHEVNGRGFHTLGGALEVAAATRALLVRRGAARPTRADFEQALATWRANGLAVWHKYGAGNCVAHAEVLRARIQRELGLSSEIVCVRYADSKRPLDHAWDYSGTVHADVLVPFIDDDQFRAVHVVCGMGIGDHFHVFDSEAGLLAHLDDLAYARGVVVDPAELTRTAFGTKARWWIAEGPDVGDAACKLGVDVIAGRIGLDATATARHRGPRPVGGGNISVPLAWSLDTSPRELVDGDRRFFLPGPQALRVVVDAMRLAFGQPADFTDNLVFIAEHLDAWCAATLCEPGPSLRQAHRRAARTFEEPSREVVDMLALVDAGEDPLRHAVPVPHHPLRTRALVQRQVRDHVRALAALPRWAVRARHAMAAELVRLAIELPAPAPETHDDDPPPSVLDVVPPAGDDDMIGGVRFDPVRRVYVPARVPATVVHSLHLRLAQFLEWELESLSFSAPRALVDRLVARSLDPATGHALVDPVRVAELVAAIGDVAHANDEVARIGSAPVELWLTASRGGDRLEQLDWALPPTTLARLYTLLDDWRGCLRLFEVADAERAAAAAAVELKRQALAAVLEQHRGRPNRHKRVHWAFVNLASAGQTTREMRGASGVLPADATTLEPSSLRTRYRDAQRTHFRFVLTDRFELNILGDERYWDTVARWGFPPNHETLAATRPILASGYLTIEAARIVAIEDDGVMIPGKLGDGLPPIQEVIEALGYDIDLARVGSASLVVDWEAFAEAAERQDLPPVPATDNVTEYLASRSHAERPALVAAWMRTLQGDRDAIVRAAAAGLRGFRLINVSGRALAAGELPKGAEWIDETLARYLVRKVLG